MKALTKWLLHSAIDGSDGKCNQFALFFQSCFNAEVEIQYSLWVCFKGFLEPLYRPDLPHGDPVRLDLCVAQKNQDMTGL